MPKTAKNPRPVKKPKLGQNFLSDASGAMKIVEALGDISEATVVEIGPGRGAITDLLVRRAKRVIAVEIDRVVRNLIDTQMARVAIMLAENKQKLANLAEALLATQIVHPVHG